MHQLEIIIMKKNKEVKLRWSTCPRVEVMILLRNHEPRQLNLEFPERNSQRDFNLSTSLVVPHVNVGML